MVKFYELGGLFYLEIDDSKYTLSRDSILPVLVGAQGSEALYLEGTALGVTAVSSIYNRTGDTAYTADTLKPLLVLYQAYLNSAKYVTLPDTEKVTLIPAMQHSVGTDKPITIHHLMLAMKVDVRCEDKDGIKFEADSFIQNTYEIVGGTRVCTKTTFWFSGTNADNYTAYFKYEANINY